jgi:hypothetical protein
VGVGAGRGLGKCTQAHTDTCTHTDTEGRGWDGDRVHSRAGRTPMAPPKTASFSLMPLFYPPLPYGRNIACLYFMAKLF